MVLQFTDEEPCEEVDGNLEAEDTLSSRQRGDSEGSNTSPAECSWNPSDRQSSSSSSSENVNSAAKIPNINANESQLERGQIMEILNISVPNNEAENIDVELLCRPSWCDADFALSQVKKGNAVGNKYALSLRSVLHRFLFRLGCFIQKHAAIVLVIGLAALGICGVGLRHAFLENNIEKLWVESGGELASELQYRRDIFANTGLSETGAEYTLQLLIQTGEDTLTLDSLLLHLRAAYEASQISVEKFNRTWSYTDLCYKFDISSLTSGTPSSAAPIENIVGQIIEGIVPCLNIGPLDCFWDGSKLLETEDIFLPRGADGRPVTWRNLNPLGQFDQLSALFRLIPSFAPLIDKYRGFLLGAGLETGYVKRWCLDPFEDECPSTAPNYKDSTPLDFGAIFNRGCTGFAAELMEWPLDLIIGGIQRNASDFVTGAQGLQTIFSLRTTEGFFNNYQNLSDTIEDWSMEKAEQILQSWQRKFVATMYEINENQSYTRNSSDQIDAFTETTALDILHEFSNISIGRLVLGYVFMIVYACLTLMKVPASRSQGAVGIVGVLLVVLSVVAGLGICSAVGISFNAASTQVLPFLLLGLGVDDMFLISHHFGEISVMSHIPYEHRMGVCLKRVGVSVVLTSVAILSGFLFSLIIPMPALQAFVLQAAVVTIFNLISMLIIFPAILSLDLLRRKHNRLDFICCCTSLSRNEVLHGTSNHSVQGSSDTSNSYETNNVNKNGFNVVDSSKSVAVKKQKNSFVSYLSLSEFGERYYAPFLLKNPVRVVVLVLFGVILGGSIYGCFKVKDGLDLGDVLPRDSREHDAIVAQTNYFAFYNMYLVTQEFDYPSNQPHLDRLHDSMENLSYVLRNIDGTLPKYWLQYMRDWLQILQEDFDTAWDANDINNETWQISASENAILTYKLLIQTGDPSNPIDRSRVRCINGTSTCSSADLENKLLTSDGEIPWNVFYNYLTAWYNEDILTVASAQALIQPEPITWSHERDGGNFTIPASSNIRYAQMPFYLNNMRENEDFVTVINWVRGLIESVEAESTVIAYPNGYPFTFWQQYITLRFWLFISLACVIVVVFLVVSLILLNPWAAAIMALFLAMIATELLGFMGLTGVKLSAVPAVILVASIGLGVEFTVHITFAYITSCGSRNERVIYSVGHMIGPVVDGSISTLLGVIMLAWAEFDFIVTYFFQVLAMLILLGALNGLVLLPVVLSLVGPPPEVSPKDGGSHLTISSRASVSTPEKQSKRL